MKNHFIETADLYLRPLNQHQLLQYIRMDTDLEKGWNLNPAHREISAELKEALEDTILPSVADTTKNYLFSTLWVVIRKDLNQMVAALCFKGEPNHLGEIEIGYGTFDSFQGRGYMTQAVAAIIPWAAQQSSVVSITAETEKTNPASIAVLVKNQFAQVNDLGSKCYWKLNLK
jgi:ribosomal-protein-alanine N-acetyltransferase